MIAVEQLSLQAGRFRLSDIDLTIPHGTYGVLMGRTGCGKTTLLEAILGIRAIQSGAIRLNHQEITHLKPALRGIGYVPQDGVLFSTMTVREQIGFPLRIRGAHARDIRQRVDELAERLSISHLLSRGIARLSGGEKQRVALGRALSFYPDILLLDEPLSALDEQTRDSMFNLLKSIQRELEVTTLHVTHSLIEAEHLADRMYLLKDNAIREIKPRQSH